jgi:hypothetical protein
VRVGLDEWPDGFRTVAAPLGTIFVVLRAKALQESVV